MRRTGAWTAAVACAAALAFSATATAATRTVFAGSDAGVAQKLTQKIAGKLIPNVKSFVGKYNPDINNFFTQRVTINAGDTVKFQITGFHTVDLPGSTKDDLPLIVPGSPTTGVNDAAGIPFWFNGLPSVGINPQLFASRAQTRTTAPAGSIPGCRSARVRRSR